MDTTTAKETSMNELPADLIAKMEAAKKASAEKCATCGKGVGKWCEHRATRK